MADAHIGQEPLVHGTEEAEMEGKADVSPPSLALTFFSGRVAASSPGVAGLSLVVPVQSWHGFFGVPLRATGSSLNQVMVAMEGHSHMTCPGTWSPAKHVVRGRGVDDVTDEQADVTDVSAMREEMCAECQQC